MSNYPMYSAGDYNAWLSAQPQAPEQVAPVAGDGAAGVCRCGTFAIGICQTCGSPMCGRSTCGAFAGVLACATCLAKVEESRRQEEAKLAKRAFQQREEHRRLLESLPPCTPADFADLVLNRIDVPDGILNGRRYVDAMPWTTIAEYLLEGGIEPKRYTRDVAVRQRNWYGRSRLKTVAQGPMGWAVLKYKSQSSARFGVTNEHELVAVLRTDGTFEEGVRQVAGAKGSWVSIGTVIRTIHLPHRTQDPFPVTFVRSFE